MGRLTKNEVRLISLAPHDTRDTPFVIVNYVQGFFCSICALEKYSKEEIEAMALEAAEAQFDSWEARDSIDFGGATRSPGPCNQEPGRQHWFLVSLSEDDKRRRYQPRSGRNDS